MNPIQQTISRGWHGIADAVCVALETLHKTSNPSTTYKFGSSYTPSFLCLRTPHLRCGATRVVQTRHSRLTPIRECGRRRKCEWGGRLGR